MACCTVRKYCLFLLCFGFVFSTGYSQLPVSVAKQSFGFKLLGDAVNTSYPETHPLLSGDGNTLFFSRSNHPVNFGKEDRADIWVASKGKNGEWERAINLGRPVNNSMINYPVGVTNNGQRLFFVSQAPLNNPQVFVSDLNGRIWTRPLQLQIEGIEDFLKVSHLNISRDGNFGLLTGMQYGEESYDVFVIKRIKEHLWSRPERLPAPINSSGNELKAFLGTDNRTVYFLREIEGPGNKNLFMSKRLKEGWKEWSAEMEWPNTHLVDSWGNITTSPDRPALLFEKGNGEQDKDIAIGALPSGWEEFSTALCAGKILNAQTQEALNAQVRLMNTGKDTAVFTQKYSDNFQISIPLNNKYYLLAEREGFLMLPPAGIIPAGKIAEPIDQDLAFSDRTAIKGANLTSDVDFLWMIGALREMETEIYALERQKVDSLVSPVLPVIEFEPIRKEGEGFNREKQQEQNLKLFFGDYLKQQADIAPDRYPQGIEQVFEAIDKQVKQSLRLQAQTELKKTVAEDISDKIWLKTIEKLPSDVVNAFYPEKWEALIKMLRTDFEAFINSYESEKSSITLPDFLEGDSSGIALWDSLVDLRKPRIQKGVVWTLEPEIKNELTFFLQRKWRERVAQSVRSDFGLVLRNKTWNRDSLVALWGSFPAVSDNFEKSGFYKGLDLKLLPLELNVTIPVEGVDFESNSNRFTYNAESGLKYILYFMEANPGLKVEVGVHSNCLTGDIYAAMLTELRAQEVCLFLEGAGISSDRFIAKGYGTTQPLYDGDKPEDHRQNQRVELKVISY